MPRKQPAPNSFEKYNASFLKQPHQDRYLMLCRKASLSDEERAERLTLLRMVTESRDVLDRHKVARPHIERADAELRKDRDNPVVQREFLRTIVNPCYPNMRLVFLELTACGAYTPRSYRPMRQGLEHVFYAMDFTVMVNTLADPALRVHFLTSLDMMLEPFRKLKAGEKLDLNKVFEFRPTGSGTSTLDELDLTLSEWEKPCFDLHLLYMAGVEITPAQERVAMVHGKDIRDISGLRKAYVKWRNHPVRKEVLRRGDEHVRKLLLDLECDDLLSTAFPAPRKIRAHRQA